MMMLMNHEKWDGNARHVEKIILQEYLCVLSASRRQYVTHVCCASKVKQGMSQPLLTHTSQQ